MAEAKREAAAERDKLTSLEQRKEDLKRRKETMKGAKMQRTPMFDQVSKELDELRERHKVQRDITQKAERKKDRLMKQRGKRQVHICRCDGGIPSFSWKCWVMLFILLKPAKKVCSQLVCCNVEWVAGKWPLLH